jgi:hypothetical protein
MRLQSRTWLVAFFAFQWGAGGAPGQGTFVKVPESSKQGCQVRDLDPGLPPTVRKRRIEHAGAAYHGMARSNPERKGESAVSFRISITHCKQAGTGAGDRFCPNNKVVWGGNSSWWIIETIESFNGWHGTDQGNFTQWFSGGAFGGAGYENTPVAAVSHTDEPTLAGINDSPLYFGLWASGKSFAICAWNSLRVSAPYPPAMQAVGDPFITR